MHSSCFTIIDAVIGSRVSGWGKPSPVKRENAAASNKVHTSEPSEFFTKIPFSGSSSVIGACT